MKMTMKEYTDLLLADPKSGVPMKHREQMKAGLVPISVFDMWCQDDRQVPEPTSDPAPGSRVGTSETVYYEDGTSAKGDPPPQASPATGARAEWKGKDAHSESREPDHTPIQDIPETETVRYEDGSSATGRKPMPRVSPSGSPAIVALLLCLLSLFAPRSAHAQLNTVIQTSLSAAITNNQKCFAVASATGIVAPTVSVAGSTLFIQDLNQTQGEAVNVQSISGTTVCGSRGTNGNGRATAHISGASVLVATVPTWFVSVDPQGACTTANLFASPRLNIQNGNQWLCSSQTLAWVPSWGTANEFTAQLAFTTATASVAGATAINAPLVHISGALAITSFTMGIGWNGQGFCVIPDGAFTTTATNNILKASTAVVNRPLCFTYDSKNAGFVPSY
jgi:hypothetical protein